MHPCIDSVKLTHYPLTNSPVRRPAPSVGPVDFCDNRCPRQKTSARQDSTSSLDSRGWILDDPSDRTITASVDGFADTIVTCGGTKPRGSQRGSSGGARRAYVR